MTIKRTTLATLAIAGALLVSLPAFSNDKPYDVGSGRNQKAEESYSGSNTSDSEEKVVPPMSTSSSESESPRGMRRERDHAQ